MADVHAHRRAPHRALAPAPPAGSAATGRSPPSSTASTPTPIVGHRPGPRARAHPRRQRRRQHADHACRSTATTQLTLARQIQRHPTRGDLVHVDFVRVRRDVAVTRRGPARTSRARPPGVKDGGLARAAALHAHRRGDAGRHPERRSSVDVSRLELGDQLRVADLADPDGRHAPARARRARRRRSSRPAASTRTRRGGRGRGRRRGRRGRGRPRPRRAPSDGGGDSEE